MIITNEVLQNLSKKYNLDYSKFKFTQKKNFFKIKYYIYYSSEEYFFEISRLNKDLKIFFPYFAKLDGLNELDNIEIWIKSIRETQGRNQKIVSNLKDGLNKRNEFKSKYKV